MINSAVIWHVIKSEAERGTAGMLGDVLRSHFTKIKPRMLAELSR